VRADSLQVRDPITASYHIRGSITLIPTTIVDGGKGKKSFAGNSDIVFTSIEQEAEPK
jgi:hypothetical protein